MKLSLDQCKNASRRLNQAVEAGVPAISESSGFETFIPKKGFYCRFLPERIVSSDCETTNWRDQGIERLLREQAIGGLIAWPSAGALRGKCFLRPYNEPTRLWCAKNFVLDPMFFCAPTQDLFLIFDDYSFCIAVGANETMLKLDAFLGGYGKIVDEFRAFVEHNGCGTDDSIKKWACDLIELPEASPKK